MKSTKQIKTKNSLTLSEVETYREEGLVIPKFRLPTNILTNLQNALEELIRNNPGVRPEKLISAHVDKTTNEGVKGSSTFLQFAGYKEILDMVEDLIGSDIILWGCHMFCKTSGDGLEVPWHQDGHYWPIRPLATCTAWVALDFSTPENGAMRYIPASHKSHTHYTHYTDNSNRLVLNQALMPGQIDESLAKPVILEPGQISLHDVYLVHGSPANRSNQRRAGLAIRYMPATSYFDREIPATDQIADFSTRPIWLLRGSDRSGKNDFQIGH
jgi:ectoine hydroxylase-related dioxygenase (phytanoyl-CoA dioxygenase family)